MPFDRLDRLVAPTQNPLLSPTDRAAVDIALLDLAGRISGLPVHALLGGKLVDTLPLCYAISGASPEEMGASARKWSDCSCFKVKIAGQPERDAERVHAVREAAPDMPIWLDANQSYSFSKLLVLLDLISDVKGIRCIEQPTRSTDWTGLARIRERSRLPVAIDEGCFSPEDAARVAKMNVADQVVVKVCKAGGLRQARTVAETARLNGLDVLASGLTDSGVAFSAAIHLFSTLELALPPELNGPQFLESMLVGGLEIGKGAVVPVPDGPGLGVRVDEAAIRALTMNE